MIRTRIVATGLNKQGGRPDVDGASLLPDTRAMPRTAGASTATRFNPREIDSHLVA
jgi:hypothetical protein